VGCIAQQVFQFRNCAVRNLAYGVPVQGGSVKQSEPVNVRVAIKSAVGICALRLNGVVALFPNPDSV
jgi:hypothetical protein